MRRLSVLLTLIISIGLVASACGDSGSDSSSDTTAPSTTTTTIPPASADKAKAEAIILTQADLGAGYTPVAAEGEGEEEEETPEADAAFKECSQNNPVLNSEAEDRFAESEFEKGEFTTVSSQVEFWTNEADFKAAMDIVASDAFVTCINGAFQKLFAELGTDGATISDVKTTKKAVTAAGVDQSTGLATSMTISAGPVKVNLFIDMAFLRKGRAGAILMTMNAQKAFPAAESTKLTAVLAQRLSANAA